MTAGREPTANPPRTRLTWSATSRCGRVHVVVLALGVLTGLFALLASRHLPGALPWSPAARLAIVVGLVAVAQLARLRLRLPSGSVSVTWAEAALIIGLYLVPAGWLPAAAFVGAGAAWLLLAAVSDHTAPAEALYTAASVTLGVCAAVAVTTAFADPLAARVTPELALALALGSLAYLVVTGALASLSLAVHHQVPLRGVLVRALRGKLLMFVGNVVVGLVVISMVDRDPKWLLGLPPALWVLQQTYALRLRGDDERRAWEAFAEATGALNQLDERRVAAAGVTGALTLFGAERVELDVLNPGPVRRYVADPERPVLETAAPAPPDPPAAARRTEPDDRTRDTAPQPSRTVVRTLSVGDVPVGELRVRYPQPVAPGSRDESAMAAFADALGGALHDAATHRELRVLAARSSHDAVHDSLTGLSNRAALLEQGDRRLRQLQRGHPVGILLLDIDHFKEVNETLGHAAGDELLVATAERLRSLAQPGELLARLGGDEFALLTSCLPNLTDVAGAASGTPLSAALRRAKEIVDLLAEPTEVAGVRLVVEASVGVVVAGAGTADMAELVRRADIAMYQAKDGGTSVAAYDDARDAASTDELALLAEMGEALAGGDQLTLALQPAVDLVTGAPTGVEALIRWHHPRRGWLMPADFLRTIEGSELLGPFTCHVLDRALGAAADWATHGIELPISVNISARSLLDARLPADIAELLRRHRVPARLLVLEITETVVMSEHQVVDVVLAELRALGVQLSVDDFGTGYSSLTFLTRFPVDELKVDRSFVGQMADSAEAAAIVRTTVDLGRGLGLRVVAEGVETAAQRAALADLGCTAAQGYHFCRPLPSDKIVSALHSLAEAAPPRLLSLRADDAS